MLFQLTRALRIAEAQLTVGVHPGLSATKLASWHETKNIFFVLSLGRSGTNFLADLLNRAEHTMVVHEPHQVDDYAIEVASHKPTAATTYIRDFRRKDIYLRARGADINTYGEVNSLLRRHARDLQEVFPQAHFVHLIRDGRDVVRSMLTRRTLTPQDPKTARLTPPFGDPYLEQWPTMSRFERLCWYWQHENNLLERHIDVRVRFEPLVSDYNYFKKELLANIGVELSEGVWQEEVRVPKNHTKGKKAPHWRDWTPEQTRAFWTICGEAMARYGYQP